MNFMAIFSPLFALGAVWYMLKAIGLGNMFKPGQALAMATGGAAKLTGDKSGAGTGFVAGATRAMSPVARANAALKWGHGDSRTRQLTRLAGRGVRKAGRGSKGGWRAMREYRKGDEDKRKEMREELADKVNPLAAARRAIGDRTGRQAAWDGAKHTNAATTALLANLGIFLAGANSDAAKLMRPLTYAKDNNALAQKHRESKRELTAKLKGVDNDDARREITASHYSQALDQLGRTNRHLADGALYDPLTPSEQKARAAVEGRRLHVPKEDLLVNPVTGGVIVGVQSTKLPNLGSEEAILSAARSQHHYFPDSFKARLPGEEDGDWAMRMEAGMIVMGGVDPSTGERLDMLAKLGIKDNAEGRKKVMDSTDPHKKPAITHEVAISSTDHAAINLVLEKMRSAPTLTGQLELRDRVAVAQEKASTVIAGHRDEFRQEVSAAKELASGLTGKLGSAEALVELEALVGVALTPLLQGAAAISTEIAGVHEYTGAGDQGAVEAHLATLQRSHGEIAKQAEKQLIACQTAAPEDRAAQQKALLGLLSSAFEEMNANIESGYTGLGAHLRETKANLLIDERRVGKAGATRTADLRAPGAPRAPRVTR